MKIMVEFLTKVDIFTILKRKISNLPISESFLQFGYDTFAPEELREKYRNILSSTPVAPPSRAAAVELAREAITKALPSDEREKVLLFSGGIDSTYLLDRCIAKYGTPPKLVHCHVEGCEHDLAAAKDIARYYDAELDVVEYVPDRALRILEDHVKNYPHPFRDPSVLPTLDLAQYVLDTYGSEVTVFDGTAAGGVFGLYNTVKKRKIYDRRWGGARLLSKCLALLPHSCYFSNNFVAKVCHRLKAVADGYASTHASNNLVGIGIAAHEDHDYRTVWLDWLEFPDEMEKADLIIHDLMYMCEMILRSKAESFYQGMGGKPVFPFLDDDVIRTGLSFIPLHHPSMPDKWALKDHLEEMLPPDLIHRKEIGFSPRVDEILRLEPVRERISPILDGRRELSRKLVTRSLRSAYDRILQRDPVNYNVENFFWGLYFLDAWSD